MGGRKPKQLLRPRKGAAERLRRFRLHQRRLIALGMPEDEVRKLDFKQARQLLRRPAQLKKKLAALGRAVR